MNLPQALLLALLSAASGCSRRTDLLPATSDGATGCSPSIHLGSQAPCAGALAAQLLRYALCSCSALVLDHDLYIDGSPPGPPNMAAPSASIGTDQFVQVAGLLQVDGALAAAGTPGASFSRTSAVLGSFHSGGPVTASQFLSIGGDAFVDGDVLGRIDVANTLHVPIGANVAPSVSAAKLTRQPVHVAPPCDCNATPPFDLAALVMARSSINDNAQIGLSPDALAKGSGPTQLMLPCGEYYLSAIDVPDDELELIVRGRAALFVAGDVSLGRGLRVTLDDQAELDLVVMGDLTVTSGMVGALETGAVRLWLASATIQMGSGASLSAAVYAPGAVLLSDEDLSARGALFVAGLSVAGDVGIHFDPGILSAGASCGAPPQAPVQ